MGLLGGLGKIAEGFNPTKMLDKVADGLIDKLPLPKELKGLAKGLANNFIDKAALAACPQLAALKAVGGASGFDQGGGAGAVASTILGGAE